MIQTLHYKPESVRVRFPIVLFEMFIDIILCGRTYVPGVNLVSNVNEYHEYFLGIKAAGTKG